MNDRFHNFKKYLNILIVLTVWAVIFYLYQSDIFKYDTNVPSHKLDKPSMNEIEALMKPITENLPTSNRISQIDKERVMMMNAYYKDISIKQKETVLNNINNQNKWQWIDDNRGNGATYCYNQFELTLDESLKSYGSISDNNIDIFSIAISWWHRNSICRENYYKSYQ